MRTIISTAAAFLLMGALQLVSGSALHAQERTRADLRREWLALANGRTEFDIADPALVPTPLARQR
jgi:hypothetical protein